MDCRKHDIYQAKRGEGTFHEMVGKKFNGGEDKIEVASSGKHRGNGAASTAELQSGEWFV